MPAHARLLIAMLILNVTARTFTIDLQILPRLFNIIDIPLTYVLFVISTSSHTHPPFQPIVSLFGRRIIALLLVFAIGTLLNIESTYFQAALAQINLLIQPILLFIAILRLNLSLHSIAIYKKTLYLLILLQIAVGTLQLPRRIATGNSEDVYGTFPGNAEQFAAFVLLGVFYAIALLRTDPRHKLRYLLGIFSILVLIISVDNKASWLGILLSLATVFTNIGYFKSTVSKLAIASIFTLSLVSFLTFISLYTSTTLYKLEKLYSVVDTTGLMSLGKVKSYSDILTSWLESPHMFFVGAGAGNMYSRSSRQFFARPGMEQILYSNPNQLSDTDTTEFRASNSLGGAISRTTKPPYYFRFFNQRNSIVAVGSAQVDGPFSPYAGLLGETGLVGATLYLSFYLYALRRLLGWTPHLLTDTNILPIHLCALGLLVYILVNSVYGPFLETTRYTTILWSLIAMVFSYVGNTSTRHVSSQPNPCR